MQPQDAQLDERLRQLVRDLRIVERDPRGGQLGRARRGYTSCTTCSLNGKLVPRSCASVVLATAQPWFELADEVVVGHEHVVEEHLVELGLAGDLDERPDLDARRVHVDDEVRDAAVLRRVGIGAGQADPPPGELRVATSTPSGPISEPAAVDRAAAVVRSDARSEPASGSLNSWHQISLGVEDRRQPAPLLLVGAVGEQRRPGQVDADPVDRLGRARPGRTPC